MRVTQPEHRGLQWLKVVGWPLLEGIATFWASRVHCTASQCSILQVMVRRAARCRCRARMIQPRPRPTLQGPDEYNYPVNNSGYTNAVAKERRRTRGTVSVTGLVTHAGGSHRGLQGGLCARQDRAGQLERDCRQSRRSVRLGQALPPGIRRSCLARARGVEPNGLAAVQGTARVKLSSKPTQFCSDSRLASTRIP